jgi:hypothetical protein
LQVTVALHFDYKAHMQHRSKFVFKPKKLKAALFYSQHGDGSKDNDSLHGACPVVKVIYEYYDTLKYQMTLIVRVKNGLQIYGFGMDQGICFGWMRMV